jgi:hypothetical protein
MARRSSAEVWVDVQNTGWRDSLCRIESGEGCHDSLPNRRFGDSETTAAAVIRLPVGLRVLAQGDAFTARALVRLRPVLSGYSWLERCFERRREIRSCAQFKSSRRNPATSPLRNP